MMRKTKDVLIRQGRADAEILAAVLSGKVQAAPIRILAMAERLRELAREVAP